MYVLNSKFGRKMENVSCHHTSHLLCSEIHFMSHVLKSSWCCYRWQVACASCDTSRSVRSERLFPWI